MKAQKQMKKMITIACVAFGFSAVAAPKVKIDKIENTSVWSTKKVTYTISDVEADTHCPLAFDVTAYGVTKKIERGTAQNGTFTETLDTAEIFGETRKDPNAKIRVSIEKWRGLPPVQLWENGPYFAQCNVGATKPEEYGYYFWWGDTVGYKRNANNDGWVSVKDGTTPITFDDNPPASSTMRKVVVSLYEGGNGYINAKGTLRPEHDAARAYLGGPWRMPTRIELDALGTACTSVWTNNWNGTGVNGWLVKGRGDYASKSIFLPAAGLGSGAFLGLSGSSSCYWSSTPNSDKSSNAWCWGSGSAGYSRGDFQRFLGQSVRAVREFAE